ncbi:unnamed protein product, partial [marine sediment metagenome]
RIEKVLRENEKSLQNRNKIFEADLKNAQVLQRALLPDSPPQYKNLNIDFKYHPLEAVGGDFFSFTDLKEGGKGIFIGDVESHGVSASLFISLLKFATNSACRLFGQNPMEYLTKLNEDLIGNMANTYMTGMYVFLKFNEKNDLLEVTISSGGHPRPLFQSFNTGKVNQIDITGPIIGYQTGIGFTEISYELMRGDRIYLYTDGLKDVLNDEREILDTEGLIAIIEKVSKKNISKTIDNIFSEISHYNDGETFIDDALLIVIENSVKF